MIDDRNAQLTLADLQFAEGDFAKAEGTLRSILKTYDSDIETLFKLATVQARQQKLDDARRTIERLMVLAPWHTDGRILQAKLTVTPAIPAEDRIIPNKLRMLIFAAVASVAAILLFFVVGADVRGSDYEKQTVCGLLLPTPTLAPEATDEPTTAPTDEPADTPEVTGGPLGGGTAATPEVPVTTASVESSNTSLQPVIFLAADTPSPSPTTGSSGTPDAEEGTPSPSPTPSPTPYPMIGADCKDSTAVSVIIREKSSSTPDNIPVSYITLITLFLITAASILMYPSLDKASFAQVTLDFKDETPKIPPHPA